MRSTRLTLTRQRGFRGLPASLAAAAVTTSVVTLMTTAPIGAAPPVAQAPAAWIGRQTASGRVTGTYAESPSRVGPFANARGHLYFLNEVSEANPELQMLKSADGGNTWREVAAPRPSGRDLEAADIQQIGSRLAIAHQRSGGNVYFHLFRTSSNTAAPDTWQMNSEVVASSTTSSEQSTAIGVFPDNSVIQLFNTTKHGGYKIAFRIRSRAAWTWGSEKVLDAGVGDTYGAMGVMDSNGVYHVFYASAGNDSIYYRTITVAGAMSSVKVITSRLSPSSSNTFPMAPAVRFAPGGRESVMLAYMTSDYKIETVVVPVAGGAFTTQIASDRPAASDAGTSRMPIMSIATDGLERAYLVYADRPDYDLWVDRWAGSWGADIEVNANVTAHWVRSVTRTRPDSGEQVFGYVWDMGSGGHVGDSWYTEWAVA